MEKRINLKDINNIHPKIINESNIYLPSLIINENFYLDIIICKLCFRIVDNPYFQYCGCFACFCYDCIFSYHRQYNNKCPICHSITSFVESTEKFKEIIFNINLRCVNNNKGCKWQGLLIYYEKHLSDECLFNNDNNKKLNNNFEINSMNINNINEKYSDILNDNHLTNSNNIYELVNNTNYFFNINNNIIESLNLNGKFHLYIFFNKKYDIPLNDFKNIYSFSVEFLSYCDWLGIGLCNKNIIKQNNYKFLLTKEIKDEKERNFNGCYFITNKGLSYNFLDIKNIKIFNSNYLNEKGTEITVIYNRKKQELNFKFNEKKFIVRQKNVSFINNENLSPFLIFLYNSKIKTIFNY